MIKALSEEKFDELVDPKLESNYNTVEMQRLIASAAACVRHSARRRPKMSQVHFLNVCCSCDIVQICNFAYREQVWAKILLECTS
jgi:hypothetical protein